MNILKIKKADALKQYAEADNKGKQILENLFGKEMFVVPNITDKVKTFEDACKVGGKNAKTILPYLKPKSDFERALNAVAMLFIIAEVLREGWVADYDNGDQRKFYPWFEKEQSGFGFSVTSYVISSSGTAVGSRLCFPTSELAAYFGKQFIAIHNQVLLINQK